MRDIVWYPDPVLSKKCRELSDDELKNGVAEVAGEKVDLRQLVDEMTEIMRGRQGRGIGLAAPQVGVPIRLFIFDMPARNAAPLVLANPVISEKQGTVTGKEGCLSLPGIVVNVKRAEKIKLSAKTLAGEPVTMNLDGVLSRVCQHEAEHLDGVLIISKAGIASLPSINRQLDRLEQAYKRHKALKRKPS
jgi:peptide deformylase